MSLAWAQSEGFTAYAMYIRLKTNIPAEEQPVKYYPSLFFNSLVRHSLHLGSQYVVLLHRTPLLHPVFFVDIAEEREHSPLIAVHDHRTPVFPKRVIAESVRESGQLATPILWSEGIVSYLLNLPLMPRTLSFVVSAYLFLTTDFRPLCRLIRSR